MRSKLLAISALAILAGCAGSPSLYKGYELALSFSDELHAIADTYGCEVGLIETGEIDHSSVVVELTCPAGEAADAAAHQLSLAAMAKAADDHCDAGEAEQILTDGLLIARTHLSCQT